MSVWSNSYRTLWRTYLDSEAQSNRFSYQIFGFCVILKSTTNDTRLDFEMAS